MVKKISRIKKKEVPVQEEEDGIDIQYRMMTAIFIFFPLLCLFTSFYFDKNTAILQQEINDGRGEIGPIEVPEKKTVFNVQVRKSNNDLTNDLNQRDSSNENIVTEVYDKNKKFQFSFGENINSPKSQFNIKKKLNRYSLKMTLTQKMSPYYLKFRDIDPSKGPNSSYKVLIERKRGSSLPLFILCIISLLCGLIYHLSVCMKKGTLFLQEFQHDQFASTQPKG